MHPLPTAAARAVIVNPSAPGSDCAPAASVCVSACHGEFPPSRRVEACTRPLEGEGGPVAGCLSCHDPAHEWAKQRFCSPGHRPSALTVTPRSWLLQRPRPVMPQPPTIVRAAICPTTAAQPQLLTGPKQELCAECHDLEDEDLVAAHTWVPIWVPCPVLSATLLTVPDTPSFWPRTSTRRSRTAAISVTRGLSTSSWKMAAPSCA